MLFSNHRSLLLFALVCIASIALCLVCLSGCSNSNHSNTPSNSNSISSPPTDNSAEQAPEPVPADTLELVCPQFSTAADAFLLRTATHAVLIDTGEDTNATAVLALLREKNVTTLDALILTHFDNDHIGGAAVVLKAVQVKNLYRTRFTADSEQYDALTASIASTPVQTLSHDTLSLALDELTLTLYPPLQDSYDKKEDNNSSIITAVQWGDSKLLFMGDAEKQRIKEFLNNQYDGTAYQVLKVPHHGRDPKQLAKLLKRFTPSHAIITSSVAEPENNDLISALETVNCAPLLTRRGTVTLHCSLDGTIALIQ